VQIGHGGPFGLPARRSNPFLLDVPTFLGACIQSEDCWGECVEAAPGNREGAWWAKIRQ